LMIAGHRTSISLEEPFWKALNDIASEKDRSVSAIVGDIDRHRGKLGLSAAVRIHILEYFRKTSSPRTADE